MTKQRVSVTLDEDLVSQIDTKVANGGFRNRSQAIETFLQDHLSREGITTALVLCGGSKDKPDGMIKLNGKPVIEHTIEHLSASGVERIILAVGSQHDQVTDHFGSGSDYSAEIEYLTEDRPLGTAGSLRRLQDDLTEPFLMINGDILCRIDLDDMARTHRQSDALATMALTTVQDTSPYGVVRLKGNSIIGFTEKPAEGEAPSRLINAGLYLLEPDVIDMLPPEDVQQQVDMEDLFDELAAQQQLNGYVYDGEWHDVGN